jgi:superfamily II DNA or RNA helicase
MPKNKIPAKRFWQDEALTSFQGITFNGGPGQLILPTGTGKTRIAINIMETHTKGVGRHGFYGVIVPRLLLSTQWIHEMATRFMGNDKKAGLGIPVSFIIVSTGGLTGEILNPIRAALYAVIGGAAAAAVVVTTNADEIRSQVSMRQREGKSAIIAVSTYDSSARLAEATRILSDEELKEREEQGRKTNNIGPIDICFYDECHYLVNGRLEQSTKFEAALDINVTSKVFMTATPRITCDDWEYAPGIEAKGMQNHERFGEVVYSKTPLEMIEAGGIVAPKAFIVGSNETDNSELTEDSGKNKLKVCHEALSHLRKTIAETSSAPEKVGAKILVVCDGQETLRRIFNNAKVFDAFRAANPKLKIFGLCSDFGCYIDGEFFTPPVTNAVKDKLLLALRNLKPEDEAIIFHVDMISEGLDVPGINAILPFRNCGTIKFLQNLGRATRLHPEDAIRIFETGEIKPNKKGKDYIKPNCLVYFPYLFAGRDDVVPECLDMIFAMIEHYDFDSSELVEISFSYPAQIPDGFETPVNMQARNSPLAQEIKNLHIEEVDHRYGLSKYRWSRCFFKTLLNQQKIDVTRILGKLQVTPNVVFDNK